MNQPRRGADDVGGVKVRTESIDQVEVKRFTLFQVALHWGQAVFWIVLLASGGLMLIQQVLQVQIVQRATLAMVHRWTGIGLLACLTVLLIAAAAARQLGPIGRDILGCLLVRPADLLWLVKLPFTLIRPRTKLPPAGRFNAGQKLHGVFIGLALLLFGATGIGLMIQPAALAPLAIHAALFLGAAAFLVVHLFFSLINPSTRQALGAMLSGFVCYRYAASHHPLWINAGHPSHGDGDSFLSRKAVLGALGVLVVAGGGLAGYYGPQRLAAQVSHGLADGGMDALSPGGLASAHAGDPAASRCLACHRPFAGPASSACLGCHVDIQRMVAGRLGYHGRLSGDCETCHAEHRGAHADLRRVNAVTFNHQQTRYALQGRHTEVACSSCHLQHKDGVRPPHMQYIGLSFEHCTDCHVDLHRPSLGATCTKCHGETGWTGRDLKFSHDRDSAFVLRGTHRQAFCEECHQLPDPKSGLAAADFRGLGSACSACHADRHDGKYGASCQLCHNEIGWEGRNVRFDHRRSNISKLDATQRMQVCSACHRTRGSQEREREGRRRRSTDED